MPDDDKTQKALVKEFGTYVEAVGKTFSVPLTDALTRQQSEVIAALEKSRAMLDHDHEKLRLTIRDAESATRDSVAAAVTSIDRVGKALFESERELTNTIATAKESLARTADQVRAEIAKVAIRTTEIEELARRARSAATVGAVLAGLAVLLVGFLLAQS
jgi:hypothetical protein